ncbi:SDR family oxidoreductase [Bradyrhizobium sp. U87765 SZCCT0131]|uniref:SDR family NAD(P)-dependent oxidoreductase n=1 Tax=unclassified Bradyrhizobium TaxID=2631580 RepID=UPI001BA9610A|nr:MULTISPECIES: SDR family oxidoreductase [unclassified Bradyrhizobium]MBR1219800.1 SDR family oxidoreductase [Bradyrhizobium sp. U87765 SZCCT0131]MBR1262451.1 SDR family oxidoreductase [Bradyrhizobium sp. U87765 SZCCT0134]MBR1308366.1 SDR family oxidoreductase [Bradyrhizobium sp. U87765 SZCCT0110]MBR1318233.1 SDR family oxidoreductase [Bradyrhizobium sp. U87765 SZCCT0109]MBR1351936.1 SDR family oxidoreductase [Bradyrhizobium sp. U87765 SZCCT0048]
MSFDLTGQRILVTGAAGGIGAAVARVLAGLGARLVLTDRVSCAAQAAPLRDAGHDVEEITLDLDSADAVTELAGRAGDLDGAVLGAGIYRPVDWDSEQWDDVAAATLATNLMMPMRLARAIAPRLAARGGGRLVLLGSIVATTGGSFPGVGPHYAASKGGLHTLVRWLAARHGGDGVLVNGVAPGVTDTAMVGVHDLTEALQRHPLKRAARPEEIAWPVAFLCSPAASFISGAILDVNGGAMMRP